MKTDNVKQRKNAKQPTALPANKSQQSNEDTSHFKGVSRRKIGGRIALAALIMFIVYFSSKQKESSSFTFAEQKETIPWRGQEIACSKIRNSDKKFPGCTPKKCGRVVLDNLVSKEEVGKLLKVAKKGLSFGGSNGGASILDLHSGALSRGENFVNIYKMSAGEPIFTSEDLEVYRMVKNKIRHQISQEFALEEPKLKLTHPTFFSEITSKPAKTDHDEYWHTHVDKDQYKVFHYTSLLYLSDYNIDFNGGRFVFVDKTNMTVEPKAGRVSIFTSGHENPHYVEKVTSGKRYAITIPFTCDEKFAISDPAYKR